MTKCLNRGFYESLLLVFSIPPPSMRGWFGEVVGYHTFLESFLFFYLICWRCFVSKPCSFIEKWLINKFKSLLAHLAKKGEHTCTTKVLLCTVFHNCIYRRVSHETLARFAYYICNWGTREGAAWQNNNHHPAPRWEVSQHPGEAMPAYVDCVDRRLFSANGHDWSDSMMKLMSGGVASPPGSDPRRLARQSILPLK